MKRHGRRAIGLAGREIPTIRRTRPARATRMRLRNRCCVGPLRTRPTTANARALVPLLATLSVLVTLGITAPTPAGATTKSVALPTFVDNDTANWWALGDSYMAGEGTFDYYANTAKGVGGSLGYELQKNEVIDNCHRSPDSYAVMLGVETSHFLACSGATIAGVQYGWQTEPSQVQPGISSASPILLSAGGSLRTPVPRPSTPLKTGLLTPIRAPGPTRPNLPTTATKVQRFLLSKHSWSTSCRTCTLRRPRPGYC